MVDLTNNTILTQICLTKIFLSFYKIKALTNNCLLISYMHLLIIDDNSSCRNKKHIYTSLIMPPMILEKFEIGGFTIE